MPKAAPTHYEVLGVKPSAKQNEIGLAFNRLMAARRREDAPPDPKGEARLREAFAVLSDLDRREAYDAQLRGAKLEPAFGAKQGVAAALFVAAVAAGAWWFMRPEPAAVYGRTVAEIREAARPAVGRLQSVDMSGESRTIGVAFAVEEGVMVTSCHGVAPTALLRVTLPQRDVRVRVTTTDEALGLCKLDAPDAGSWPLAVSQVAAKNHDKVHAAHLDARGQVIVREGKVTRVATESGRTLIESNLPVMAGGNGAPLLDTHGRVVGVAIVPADGKGWYVPIPPAWGETPKLPVSPPPPTPEPEAEGEKKPELIDPDLPAMPGNIKIDPERRKRLEKAFRPPPNVPEDL